MTITVNEQGGSWRLKYRPNTRNHTLNEFAAPWLAEQMIEA
jgi:hypothetical protein